MNAGPRRAILSLVRRPPEQGLVIPRVQSIAIELRPPIHGWLEIGIVLDDFRLASCASWVLNDPLEELVDLGLFVTRGSSGTRRVCLWAEPAGYALDAWNLNDDLAQLRLGYAKSFVPPMAGRALRLEHQCTVDRAALAAAIRDALERLLPDIQCGLDPEHWHDTRRYARALRELLGWDDTTRLTYPRMLLLNLQGKIPEGRREHRTKEQALEALRKLTDQDFGDDVEAWKRWLREHELL